MGKFKVLFVIGMFLVVGCSATEQTDPNKQTLPYTMKTLAENLDVPWALEVATDGRTFFTERSGSLRVITTQGELVAEPVIKLTDVHSESESGLLGLALHPDFANNGYLFVYYSYLEGDEIKNRVVRLVEKDNRAKLNKIIIDKLPGGYIHNGGRIKIGPDRKLYMTVGDKGQPNLAQQKDNLGGKILRLELDGKIPQDNPTKGSTIYSFGHRNPQGLAWQPGTNRLFSSEHGQSAHDEINIIDAGANYGWPIIQGNEEAVMGLAPMKTPFMHTSNTTWAPSGMTFVPSGEWKGSLLVAGLRGKQIIKITMDTNKSNEISKVGDVSYWLKNEKGRLRDIVAGPDGSLYVLTNNLDGRGDPKIKDDRIIKLIPINKSQ